jgi:hypothetical protein
LNLLTGQQEVFFFPAVSDHMKVVAKCFDAAAEEFKEDATDRKDIDLIRKMWIVVQDLWCTVASCPTRVNSCNNSF